MSWFTVTQAEDGRCGIHIACTWDGASELLNMLDGAIEHCGGESGIQFEKLQTGLSRALFPENREELVE